MSEPRQLFCVSIRMDVEDLPWYQLISLLQDMSPEVQRTFNLKIDIVISA